VQASYEECWRAVETHQSDRMQGHFVHPFDDDRFISGNGTIGLEIVEDLADVDAVIAPIGGGGLLAGAAIALKALRPGIKVYAAEPATAAPLAQSFASNRPSYFDGWTASFVDGAGGKSVLETMWPLLREHVDDSIVVSLDEVAAAMAVAAERAHVIAEGAAGCAVAAALSPAMARRATGRWSRSCLAATSTSRGSRPRDRATVSPVTEGSTWIRIPTLPCRIPERLIRCPSSPTISGGRGTPRPRGLPAARLHVVAADGAQPVRC
jgi:threonine dehydratase